MRSPTRRGYFRSTSLFRVYRITQSALGEVCLDKLQLFGLPCSAMLISETACYEVGEKVLAPVRE